MISFLQIIFLIATYLICAIPFGLVLAKIFGKADLRKNGSKNIGATNAARVLGKKFGICTLILDGAKAAIAVLLASSFFPENINFICLTAIVGVLAHIFPIYIKFKGGKGVATSLAALLIVNPFIGGIAVTSWLVVFLFIKISAISSISSILIATGYSFYSGAPSCQIWLCIILSILVIWRHQENISRIISGEELCFKKKSKNK